MLSISKTTFALLIVSLIIAILGTLAVMPKASAESNGTPVKVAQNTNNTQKTDDKYTYKAQANDSYTKMARKAIQTYGIDNKVNLSQAQIVYGETNLTIEAGSPELNIGGETSIAKSTVNKWVESAQKLSKEDQAAWQYYVQFVDFNTNKVGQSN